MISDKEKELIESEIYQSYIKWRTGFILKLALFHFALVFVFDALAIYAPSVMTTAAWKGSAFTVGLVYACGVVISAILSSIYYSHRINQREIFFTDGPAQLSGES